MLQTLRLPGVYPLLSTRALSEPLPISSTGRNMSTSVPKRCHSQFDILQENELIPDEVQSQPNPIPIPSRTASLADTEIVPPTPTQSELTTGLESMGIKVRDFAYTPLPIRDRTPEFWDAKRALAEYDARIRESPRRTPVSGKTLKRLLDIGWITLEEAEERWDMADWDALNKFEQIARNRCTNADSNSNEFGPSSSSATLAVSESSSSALTLDTPRCPSTCSPEEHYYPYFWIHSPCPAQNDPLRQTMARVRAGQLRTIDLALRQEEIGRQAEIAMRGGVYRIVRRRDEATKFDGLLRPRYALRDGKRRRVDVDDDGELEDENGSSPSRKRARPVKRPDSGGVEENRDESEWVPTPTGSPRSPSAPTSSGKEWNWSLSPPEQQFPAPAEAYSQPLKTGSQLPPGTSRCGPSEEEERERGPHDDDDAPRTPIIGTPTGSFTSRSRAKSSVRSSSFTSGSAHTSVLRTPDVTPDSSRSSITAGASAGPPPPPLSAATSAVPPAGSPSARPLGGVGLKKGLGRTQTFARLG